MTIRFALALALAAVLAGARAEAQPAAPGARVLQASGAVEVTSGQPGWQPARAGLALPPGAALRTGDSGRAEVALAHGTVRVYENSLLRIPSQRDPGSESVWMERGAGLFDVKLPGGHEFLVETPEAVAAVKGTRFLVRFAAGRVSVGVYGGVVELRELGADPAKPVLVRAGFGASRGAEAFELVVLGGSDPWRDWEAGAPAPELGASVPAARDDRLDASADPAVREEAEDAALDAADAVLESERAAGEGDASGDRDADPAEGDGDDVDRADLLGNAGAEAEDTGVGNGDPFENEALGSGDPLDGGSGSGGIEPEQPDRADRPEGEIEP